MGMTVSEKLEAIKLLFFGNAAPVDAAAAPAEGETEPADTKEMATATAKDGTILKWDGELGEGTELIAVTPTGDQPAPDGAIEFEDGTIVTVSGGKITAITTPPAMVEAESETKENFAEQISAIVEPLKNEIELLKTKLSAFEENHTEQLAKMKEAFSKTVDIVKEMNEAPIKDEKVIAAMFTKEQKESRAEQVARAIAAAKK